MWILPSFGILKQKIGAQCLLMYCMSFCIWLFDLGKIWYLYCVRVVAHLQHFKPAQIIFRAQFYWTEMLRSAGVLFSLFLSFYLFHSQKHTLPTFISCPHPIIQISHLSKIVGMWLLRPALFQLIASAFQLFLKGGRWLIWIIGWVHEIIVRRGCFWEQTREKERKREGEKKHLHSWTFQLDKIVL